MSLGRLKLSKITRGIQTGISGLHLILSILFLVFCLTTFIDIYPEYRDLDSNDESSDASDDDPFAGFDALGEALHKAEVIGICFSSFIGIIVAVTLIFLFGFALTGDFKNLRSKINEFSTRSSVISLIVDVMILTPAVCIFLFKAYNGEIIIGLVAVSALFVIMAFFSYFNIKINNRPLT